ncbi:MAG: hypothetical protein H0U76_18055 [Ktedonobacteraceae bacterium]|nr:hypothetical protein [Ktedonobacteraceae bacterium]
MNTGEQNLSTPLMVEAMEGNLAAYIMYCSCIPGAQVQQEADHISALTGIHQPSLNVVLRARLQEDDAHERIAEIMKPFKARNVPMLWWIFPGTQPTNLARYLTAHGLTYYQDGPGMAGDLALLPSTLSLPPGCTIEEVESQETLDEWIKTSALIFTGTSQQIDPDYVAFERCLGWGSDQPYRRFLARLHGEPVATSAMFLGGGAAGLYSVGTLPSARRRGIGTAVSLAPLLNARARGYTLAVLESSPIGYTMYVRLGFREFCRVRSYLWSPS